MSYLLTDKYKDFINLKGLRRTFSFLLYSFKFLRDIRKYGKFEELKSFLIWEIKSKLKIWKDYLVIKNNKSQIIANKDLSKLIIHSNESESELKIKFELVKIETGWDKIHITPGNSIIGNTITKRNILFRGNKDGIITEKLYEFEEPIKTIYINSNKTIFICCSGSIFRSDDNGINFKKVLTMSSRGSMFMFHVGMTEITPEILLIGEYSNIWDKKSGWKNASNLYISYDEGLNWESTNFLKKNGVNKHIHIVKYIKEHGILVLTDGDNKKQLWTITLNGNLNLKEYFFRVENWKLLTKKHIELGGYSAILELGNSTILGTDYYGGTNFLVETNDFIKFDKKVIPNPYRRGFFESFTKSNDIIWASIHPPNFKNSKGLLMYRTIHSDIWYKLMEYECNDYKIDVISKSLVEQNYLFFSIKEINKKNDDYSVYRITTSTT